MPLYASGTLIGDRLSKKFEVLNWVAEAEFSADTETVYEGPGFRFAYDPHERPAPDIAERIADEEARLAPAPGQGKPWNGPLVGYRGVSCTDPYPTIPIIFVDNILYAEHHATYPAHRDRDNSWAQRTFFPVQVIYPGRPTVIFPRKRDVFASFALSTVLETGDERFVYMIRSGSVDQYKGVPSLPSGGVMSGKPHIAMREMVADPLTVFDHVAGTVMREFPGLQRERIDYIKVTGVQRAGDLDAQMSALTRVNVSFDDLKRLLEAKGLLGEGRKYVDVCSVAATADGMQELLAIPFPPTVQPVPVYAASEYGVDPRDVLPNLKVID